MSAQAYRDMADRLVRVLTNDPILAMDFYCVASEIVDDFDDYGPVLQANDHSVYDDSTAIVRFAALRNELTKRLDAAGA